MQPMHELPALLHDSISQGVPGKGKLLTQISIFWFKRLQSSIENHVVASSLEEFPPGVRSQVEAYWADTLEGRTLLVRKAKVVKLEAIVRGYLTGALFISSISTSWTIAKILIFQRIRMGRI